MSGRGFVIVWNVLGVSIIVASGILNFVIPDNGDNEEDDSNPIHQGVKIFESLLTFLGDALIGVVVFAYNFHRKQFAKTFNELNELWSR